MPFITLTTNANINDETTLASAISKTVASAAGKPESYVMVVINPQKTMSMAGNDAPTAFLDYRALGLPADRTAFSDALCNLVNQHLNIAGDRIYISMTDSERQNWGWNHATF